MAVIWDVVTFGSCLGTAHRIKSIMGHFLTASLFSCTVYVMKVFLSRSWKQKQTLWPIKCACGTIKMSITLPSKQKHGIESLSKESDTSSGVCGVKKVRWDVPCEKDRQSLNLLSKNWLNLNGWTSLMDWYNLPGSAGRISLHEIL